MASLHLTRYPGPVSRAKTSIARGLGATGKGVGVLHMGGGFVQYARPLASRSPPSWSGAVRGRCPGLSGRRATARRQRGNQKGPGRSQAAGDEGAQPHDQDLTRPRGIEHVSSPVSTALTSTSPPSARPVGTVGIPRILPGLRRRCGVDVSAMDTSAPPDRCHRPAPQPAATLKVPTRPAIPAARSSIILASWRRASQLSGIPLRPYSAPASCP